MIRKVGTRYVLFTKNGKKRLGTFKTREAAERREREIQRIKGGKNR